jgi:hypothetical protein
MGVDDATIQSAIRRLNAFAANRDQTVDFGATRFLAAF